MLRARRRLWVKAVSIVIVSAAGYTGLVLLPSPWWVRVVSALLLVHGCVAAATGIMHDVNHSAFSRSRAVNRALSYTADVLGGSSLLWRHKHNVVHHHNTNVMGVDADIEQAPFARLSPHQRWRPWHRFQTLYLWPLYGFLTVKWFLFGDLLALRQVLAGPPQRRPDVFAVLKLFSGKVFHATWALLLPLLWYPWWAVAVVYLVCSWAVGFTLAVTFQLAHCVDRAEFVEPGAELTGDAALAHQLATTADVTTSSRLGRAYVAWVAGGLDYQVEHHLAPRLPHTVYAAMARRVDEVCAANGLERRRHQSIGAALASHQRRLRAMSRRPAAVS